MAKVTLNRIAQAYVANHGSVPDGELAKATGQLLYENGYSKDVDQFIGLVSKYFHQDKGITFVTVKVARTHTPTQLAAVEKALAKHLEGEIKMETVVDPSILGGFVAQTNDRILDASVRTKLQQLGV